MVGGEFARRLWVIGCVPWASSAVECFSTVTQDPFGLCVNPAASQCAWQQVSGSLLGLGNGSAANFPPGVTVATTTAAVSCFRFRANFTFCGLPTAMQLGAAQ